MHRNDAPQFNEARGGSTQEIPPPFDFQGVNARVFPLRANMSRLVQFCNQFINRKERNEFVFFRPAMPIVFMQVIYYGRMAVQTRNFGWFSQHEFVFSVPVERYRMVDGKPKFESWGLLNPFIYVDKASSEIIGREVYGWPKVHGWIHADADSWIENPNADRRVATFQTMVYDSVATGQALKPRNLIEIYEKSSPTWSQFPPDRHTLLNPLNAVPDAAMNFWSLLQTAWQNIANLATGSAVTWIDNYPVKGIRPLVDARLDLEKIRRLIPMVLPINKDNHYSLFTLKQFRDAEDPRFACYQAVISSEMYLHQFNAGGMLGDTRLAMLDTTGGYFLKIHEYPSQPVVQSLGLEPTAQVVGEDGVTVSTFEPILPFWMNVDLGYDRGDIICSQTLWTDWSKPGTAPPPRLKRTELPDATPLQQPLSHFDLVDSHLYNTARGEANEEMTGPFHFPNATLRVLPLLADRNILQSFVTKSFNCADQIFEVAGSVVYMIITNFDEMASDSNNIGRWAHREVRFAVPVRWFDNSTCNRRFVSMALVSPFVYCDRDPAVNTLREVYGDTVVSASIHCPRGPWLDVNGPGLGPCVLELQTDVLPALYAGCEMERRELISVSYSDVLEQFDYTGWNRIASDWGPEIVHDLEEKRRRAREHPNALKLGKALALELLANGKPFNQITLKQFRDAHEIGDACYQALVSTDTTFDHVWDLQEIEAQMHVSIYDYPTQPIVRQLGLKAKWVSANDEARRAVLQPLRPFWMRVAMTTGVARNIAERAGTEEWRRGKTWPPSGYFTQEVPCGVGEGLVRSIDAVTESARKPPKAKGPLVAWYGPDATLLSGAADRLDRQLLDARVQALRTADPTGDIWSYFLNKRGRNHYLKLALAEWMKNADSTDFLSRAAAADLMQNDRRVDPQMIIDSILSYEWAHWGNPRFYRRNVFEEHITQLPEFCVRRDSVGTAAKDLFPREQSFETSTGGWYPKPAEDDA